MRKLLVAKKLKPTFIILSALLFMIPQLSHAWWNGDWSQRKKIALNTAENGADIKESLVQVPIAVRLHTGNFSFVDAAENGSDLRFIGIDDKTPLKYHIEYFDALNELAIVWVQVPKIVAASNSEFIWMYYGNSKAAAADDAKGSYDVNQTAVFHFSEKNASPKDQTAYGNNIGQLTVTQSVQGVLGSAASFSGTNKMTISATPSLKLSPTGGFTFSTWIKIQQPQKNAIVFAQHDGKKNIMVQLDQNNVKAQVNSGSSIVEAASSTQLMPGQWHYLVVTLNNRLVIYLDGKEVATVNSAVPDMGGDITIGEAFNGDLDELQLSNIARSADWIKAAALGQGAEAKLISYAANESDSGGGSSSYFTILLSAVTLDGWIVIGILIVMGIISFVVMISKARFIKQMEKSNKNFLQKFRHLTSDMVALDKGEDEDDLTSKTVVAEGDEYQHSSIYRVYHVGVLELKHRFDIYRRKGMELNLTPQAINAIRATIDAGTIRETHRLNSHMVLLTIAISGGPFLGLLGTVVGVMITFAAIAAAGDVNVNSIAPGIAAALVATVAGLAVAIPALFGYNYLASRIKNITADIQVFADEFITKLAENYSI